LEKRIEALKERGLDPWRSRTVTIAQIVDVVGDLTIEEFQRMLNQETSRRYVDSVCEMGRRRSDQSQPAVVTVTTPPVQEATPVSAKVITPPKQESKPVKIAIRPAEQQRSTAEGE